MKSAIQQLPVEWVKASLKYMANRDDAALYVVKAGGEGQTDHIGNYDVRTVQIKNARLQPQPFTLDTEGFTLVAHETQVQDFYRDEDIVSIYEREVRTLIKSTMDAKEVEIFDHTRRSSSSNVQNSRKVREPASIIHNDYSENSAVERLRKHYSGSPEKFSKLTDRRFAIVNLWRSINGPITVSPLALCDSESTSPEDMVSVTRKAKDRVGELQVPLFNPENRWYFYPDMQMSEALLIKTFDSAQDGRARSALHTAFDDPRVIDKTLIRESMETRCFVFF